MLNGNSKTSVLVQSDAPVLVKTVYTKKPYSECSKWSIDEWGHDYRNSIGLKLIEFSEDEHSAKRYNIPIGEVSTNDYNCYCVLVYYADGTSDMSPIWQK